MRLVWGIIWTEKGRSHPFVLLQWLNFPLTGVSLPVLRFLWRLNFILLSSYNVTSLSHGFGVVLLIYVIASNGMGPPSLIENWSIKGSS